jgi:hypothetical protein
MGIFNSELQTAILIEKFFKFCVLLTLLCSVEFPWAATHDAWAFSLREATDPVFSKVYKLFRIMTEEEQQQAAFKVGYNKLLTLPRVPKKF